MSSFSSKLLILCIQILVAETNGHIVVSQRTSPEKLSVFVENGGIYSETSNKIYENSPWISGMTFDHRNNTLFLYLLRTIGMLKNFNGNLNKYKEFEDIRIGVSEGFGSVAFDWLSENLYWTDSMHDWIAMQPAYTKDESMFKIIVSDGLRQPEGLAIDPLARYIFWSDVHHDTIERTSLSGNERKILAFKSLKRVYSMVADVDEQMLFWVDDIRGTLETCDYNGQNRRVIDRKKGSHPTSVDISMKFIYTTLYGNGHIYLYDKKTEKYEKYITVEKARVISVFNATMQQPLRGINSCGITRCPHMCVNTASDIGLCVCKEGYEYFPSTNICRQSTDFYSKGIVVTDGSRICMLTINAVSNGPSSVRCKFIGTSFVGAIAVTQNEIIFHERVTKTLMVIQMNRANLAHTLANNVGSVSDLEYDWTNEKIFWIDDEIGSIQMMYKSNPSEKLILTKNARDPQSLAIDVHSKLIFWSDSDGKSSRRNIFKLNYTDNNSSAVQILETENPRGLYIDINTGRLFWEDNNQLRSIRIDGSGYKSYDPIGMEAVHFLLHKDYAVWTNSSAVIFSRFLPSDDNPFVSSLSDISAVTDMALYDPALWKVDKGRCSINNGDCEQICLPGKINPVCECEFGFAIKNDNKTCGSGSLFKDNFALICDAANNMIYQLSLNGSKIQALGIRGLDTPLTVEYHSAMRRLFVTEYSGALKSISEDGKDVLTMFQLGSSYPGDIEIDIETNQIFLTVANKKTDTNESYIAVIHAETKVYKTLVSGLGRPQSLAIHPGKGLLFWADYGAKRHIGRSSMDGQNKITLISSDDITPSGIAIDYTANLLYWSDFNDDTIESSDFFGGNRQRILVDNRANLRKLLVRGAFIYYTAWNRRKVTKADKKTGQIIPWMSDYAEFGRMDSVDIFPKDKKPESKLCKTRKGDCSTFCFPTATHRVCGCEDGVKLLPDRKRCENVELCPEINIPNGELAATCLRYANRICEFRCDAGFEPSNGKRNISCGPLGRWIEDIDDLCQEVQEEQTPESDSQTHYIIIGASVGGGLFLVVLVVVLVVLKMRQRKNAEDAYVAYAPSRKSDGSTYAELNF